MKMTKHISAFVLLFAVLGLMSSCEDDKGTGAGDATIGFASSTYTYKESAGLVRIPVAFTGEPKSYPIVFDVKAEIVDGDKTLDQLVHFTQIEQLKYAGNPSAPAFVEFEIYDDKEINESRHMQLTIVSASGAEIANASTVVEIADNDNNPYERLWGNWTFTGNSISDGAATTFDVNISGGFDDEEVAENADKKLVCWGFAGDKDDVTSYEIEPGHQPVWYIDYDAEAEMLSIEVGTLLANTYKFNLPTPYTSFELKTASLDMSDENSDFSESVQIKGTWSEDMNTITFEPASALCAVIYGDGEYTGYYWNGYFKIVLKRK